MNALVHMGVTATVETQIAIGIAVLFLADALMHAAVSAMAQMKMNITK